MNILIIEDNLTIIKGLRYSLEKNNYIVLSSSSYKEAISNIINNHIDLIILDISLPDGNGFYLFKERIKKLNIPTIFLTVNDEEDIIVDCLESGAEDYLTKPFSTKELLARINKVICRTKKQNIVIIKDIKYDTNKMIVYKNNKIINLTPLELRLLNLLFLDIGKVVSRNYILDKIWEWTGNYVDDHTITVYFKRIREKLKSDIIITVKGLGYRIDEE